MSEKDINKLHTDIDGSRSPEAVEGEVVNLKQDIPELIREYSLNVLGIDEPCKMTDNQFCSSLIYINDKCINNIYNYGAIYDTRKSYTDVNKIRYILDIYINICLMYDKYISVRGFSLLSGIDDSVIYSWSQDKKASSEYKEIYKKLSGFSEESLVNNLATGRKNPVGNMGILNNRFSWASQTIKHEHTAAIQDNGDIAGLLGVKT